MAFRRGVITWTAMSAALLLVVGRVDAADHLDTPTLVADPAADIGDLFAWTSSDGQRLNLAMTVVAHSFSDRLQYVFHVDSGARLGTTTAGTAIVCRFDAAGAVDCRAGGIDELRGDASAPSGLESQRGRFRVFAGLRDDPFFNNVKGTRAALNVAHAALEAGAAIDAAGCPRFDLAIVRRVLDEWRHTEGGPGANFLAGWSSAGLVVSIDLGVVNGGGPLLGVWAAVHKAPAQGNGPGEQIERIGRALTGNALLAPLAPGEERERCREEYNRAAPAAWQGFAPDLALTLGLYDGFDGVCGNQWLADAQAPVPQRYAGLAALLADDRLWVDSRAVVCDQYLAVERAALGGPALAARDCGGRTPNQDAVDVFRSLLALGGITGLDDGVDADDSTPSTSAFPFLAAP